jgi:hypothetical protein
MLLVRAALADPRRLQCTAVELRVILGYSQGNLRVHGQREELG